MECFIIPTVVQPLEDYELVYVPASFALPGIQINQATERISKSCLVSLRTAPIDLYTEMRSVESDVKRSSESSGM